MKRVFSFLLALLLVVGLVPVQAMADETAEPRSNPTVTIDIIEGGSKGTVSISPANPAPDDIVTVSADCQSGFVLRQIHLVGSDVDEYVDMYNKTFKMPHVSVTLEVVIGPDSDSEFYGATLSYAYIDSGNPVGPFGTVSRENLQPGTYEFPAPDGYTIQRVEVLSGTSDVYTIGNKYYIDVPEFDYISAYVWVTKGVDNNNDPDPAPHKVNLTVQGEGDVEISHTEATAGERVTVTKATPKNQGDEVYISFTNVDGNPIMDRDANSFIMPDYDAYVTVSFRKHYQIETEVAPDASAGTVTPSVPSAPANVPVTVNVTPAEDCKLAQLKVLDKTAQTWEDITNTKTFDMPASDVKIYAEFQAKQPYAITPEITGGQGSISFTVNEVTTTTAKEGQVVAVEAVPTEGYMAQPITIKAADPSMTVELKDGKFIMPDCAVTVSTSFVKAVTVTFNYNEGTNVDNVASVIIPAGNSLSALPNTSRADHKLVGWYLPNGTKVDAETSFADDTTITARWVYAEHTTKQKGNDFEADLAMENADVLDQLLDDEDLSAALKDGLNVYVFMEVAKMSEESVPSADKTAITSKVGSNKIAAYLDITLWKQIGEDRNVAKKITNTGDAVPITMKLDAGIIPANAGSVYIVYYHGEAKEIRNVSYNHATRELTFPASEFSTYSLVYTPYVAPAAAPASSNTYVLDNVPKTGEGSALMNWTLLVLCSAAMLAAVAILDKKRAR